MPMEKLPGLVDTDSAAEGAQFPGSDGPDGKKDDGPLQRLGSPKAAVCFAPEPPVTRVSKPPPPPLDPLWGGGRLRQAARELKGNPGIGITSLEAPSIARVDSDQSVNSEHVDMPNDLTASRNLSGIGIGVGVPGDLKDELRTINRKLDELLSRGGKKSLKKGFSRGFSTVHMGSETYKSNRTSLISEGFDTVPPEKSEVKDKVDVAVVKGLYRRKSMAAPASITNGLELVLSGSPPGDSAPSATTPLATRSFGLGGWAKKKLERGKTMDLRSMTGGTLDEGTTPDVGAENSVQKDKPMLVQRQATGTSSAYTNQDEVNGKSTCRSFDSDEIARADALLAAKRTGFRRSVWNFLEDPESSTAAKWFGKFNSFFILCTVLVTIAQSAETTPWGPFYGWAAAITEIAIDGTFTLELVLRFVCCPSRLKFFESVYNWIDAFSSLPLLARWGIGWVLPPGEVTTPLHAILLCFVPILRLLKTLRRFESFHLLIKAFHASSEALPVLLYILAVIVMVFAVLIYLVEPRGNIESLPHALWLSIVTMTTVGYGDVTPKSPEGSCITGALVVITVLYMAIPLGIIGQAFNDAWQDRDRILLMQRTRDRLWQWGYTAHDIPVLFKISDENADGELELKEFRKLVNQMQIGFGEERIIKLFNSFDHDGSGTVDDHEFIRALFPEAYHEIYDDA